MINLACRSKAKVRFDAAKLILNLLTDGEVVPRFPKELVGAESD